ncbi:hypothetical protein RA19_04670 [Leisingera sp. ANG-M1]|uniref:hypothetical protein n=1 Tax=Leisingera sp. ANG-M1 TaxID=1577895 RepID=UPI0005807811|nr:hypothetical protein [Leisingera sp. ANG-M1]KIC11927.1 hypothetical protein RA19_04670 [Leisingera sp. ANG-M1]
MLITKEPQPFAPLEEQLQGAAPFAAAGLVLAGTAGDDSLTGGSEADHITCNGGADTLEGRAGNDTIIASVTGGNSLQGLIIDGGAGDDLIILSGQLPFGSEINGGLGQDTIRLDSDIQLRGDYWQGENELRVEVFDFNGFTIRGTAGDDRFTLNYTTAENP